MYYGHTSIHIYHSQRAVSSDDLIVITSVTWWRTQIDYIPLTSHNAVLFCQWITTISKRLAGKHDVSFTEDH